MPILPGTQLCLKLALFRTTPHLGELTDILQRDPGAVLRLFALRATSPGSSGEIQRLEDFFTTLGRAEIVEALCRQPPALGADRQAALAFAQQAHAVAALCRTLAEAMGLSPEQAFLVGLLHGIGGLLLRLQGPVPADIAVVQGDATLALCWQYGLPSWLRLALRDVVRGEPCSPWTALVQAAHELLPAATARTMHGLSSSRNKDHGVSESFLRLS